MDFVRGRQYLKICLHFSSIYLNKDKALYIIFQWVSFFATVALGVNALWKVLLQSGFMAPLSEAFPNKVQFMWLPPYVLVWYSKQVSVQFDSHCTVQRSLRLHLGVLKPSVWSVLYECSPSCCVPGAIVLHFLRRVTLDTTRLQPHSLSVNCTAVVF